MGSLRPSRLAEDRPGRIHGDGRRLGNARTTEERTKDLIAARKEAIRMCGDCEAVGIGNGQA